MEKRSGGEGCIWRVAIQLEGFLFSLGIVANQNATYFTIAGS